MATLTYYVDPNATGTGDGSSYTNAYTSLSACEAARQADLVTDGNEIIIYCRTSGANPADTTNVVIDGSVTEAVNHTIRIIVELANRAKGKYDTTKYRIEHATNWNRTVDVLDPYVTLQGLQVKNTAGSGNGRQGIAVNVANTTVRECIVGAANGTDVDHGGFATGYDFAGNVFINCIAVGCYHGFTCLSSNDRYYNCVSVGNAGHGYQVMGYRTFVCANCYAGGNTDTDCNDSEANTTFTLTTCASEDGTFGASTVAYSTSAGAYFTNVSAGSEDVHISSSSSLAGAGTDESGIFTTDIDGETISGNWNIGCDQPAASGGSEALTGAPAGTATVSAMIWRARYPAAAPAGTSDPDGAIYRKRYYAAAPAGTSTVFGNLLEQILESLRGTVSAVSSLSGAIWRRVFHSGTPAGTSSLFGNLVEQILEILSGTIAAVSSLAGAIWRRIFHVAAPAGVSTVFGNIATEILEILVGAITGISTVAGGISRRIYPSGGPVGNTGPTGDFFRDLFFVTAPAAISTLFGNIALATGAAASRLRIYMKIHRSH